jgi:hypothetical protein
VLQWNDTDAGEYRARAHGVGPVDIATHRAYAPIVAMNP